MKGNNVSDDGGIAVIGMACVYPGAQSPAELWENVLAQRESFRKIPPQRLPGQKPGESRRVPGLPVRSVGN